jgi:hypothetical protein
VELSPGAPPHAQLIVSHGTQKRRAAEHDGLAVKAGLEFGMGHTTGISGGAGRLFLRLG